MQVLTDKDVFVLHIYTSLSSMLESVGEVGADGPRRRDALSVSDCGCVTAAIASGMPSISDPSNQPVVFACADTHTQRRRCQDGAKTNTCYQNGKIYLSKSTLELGRIIFSWERHRRYRQAQEVAQRGPSTSVGDCIHTTQK
jgi:hypothetical protein